MTMGGRIKTLRIEKGLSQEELGCKIGVKKAAIHKYENGLVVNLKQSTIAALADALETTPAYIMGLEDDKPKYDALEEGMRLIGAIRADGSVDFDLLKKLAAILEVTKEIK